MVQIMKNKIIFLLITATTGVMFLLTMQAKATAPENEESPTFKRSLPEKYFECHTDNECVMVQGWCATFSINKKYADDYKKIPADPKGKASTQCPPGWLPPNPHPVCTKNQCSIISKQQ